MYSIIPIQAVPFRTFSCTIPVDSQNLVLTFRLKYNDLAEYWLVDISTDTEELITALPILPAEDILEQFKYMEIGSAYILPKTAVSEDHPTFYDLDEEWYLIWSDTDDD